MRINVKHCLATVAVAAGMLAPAATASAGTHLISYNGHAGLGASVYQHNQSDLEPLDARAAGVTDGTSNTIMFGIDLAGPFTPNNF